MSSRETDWRQARDRALFALEHETAPDLRTEAALTICELADGADRDEELVSLIPRLIGDRQEEVRVAGLALAAQTLPADEAEPILARSLADKAARVRVEAAGRLADLELPTARGALAVAMRDELFSVRFEAARGMAALRHPAGLETLVEALGHDDLVFRALGALAELGDASAAPAVRKVFRRWLLPAFERTQAAGTLARLGDPEGVTHLFKRTQKRWSTDRAMAIELLGEVKAPGAYERLLEILASPDDTCRGAAARGLGRLGDPRALPKLLEVWGSQGAPEDLRLDAAEGLAHLGLPEARAALEAQVGSLADPEARSEVRQIIQETRWS